MNEAGRTDDKSNPQTFILKELAHKVLNIANIRGSMVGLGDQTIFNPLIITFVFIKGALLFRSSASLFPYINFAHDGTLNVWMVVFEQIEEADTRCCQ